MRDSIYRFSLDIHSTQSQVSIPVPQYDTARGFLATLTEAGKPYHISDECRAVFAATKADGTTLFNDCLILNGSIIRYDFTEQTTSCAGIVECAIKIYGANGKILTSPRLTLVVYEGTGGELVLSEDESTILDGIMNREISRYEAEKARVAAEQARVVAEASRVMAEEEREERVNRLANVPVPKEEDNGKLLQVSDGGYILGFLDDGDLPEKVNSLERDVSNLLYAKNPLAIVSFTNNIGTVEIGSTVEEVTLSWKLNRMPATVKIGGVAQTPAESGTFTPEDGKNLKLTDPGTKTWELVATHEMEEASKKATTSVVFANRVYYAGLPEPAEYTSSFVTNITESVLRTSKPTSIKTYAERDEYVYYCQPVRLKKCVFSFGANEGGVSLVATIPVTNKKGYTEDYYIYRSDEKGLGDITLGVK